ncbi:MAG: WecB/TagA/CpsF family glycosyltransferase [Chloroflexota bacterium]
MRYRILGVPVDAVTMAEAVAQVAAWVREGGTHYIVTPNPEIVLMHGRPEVVAAIEGADLALADGVGVVWAARRLGTPVPERVAGSDISEALLRLGEREHFRFYFLGAKPGVAAAAAERAAALHPGIVIAGSHHGYFGPAEEAALAAEIRASNPDILLVGLGAPKQELWLQRWTAATGARVALGVGGVIDVLAGIKLRPPVWVRRIGLEWLYYLIRQPSRWRRQLALPRFVIAVLMARRAGR